MSRLIRPVSLLLLCVCALSACSGFLTPSKQHRQKALFEATDTYRKLMRWSYFEEAAQYLKGKGEALPRPDLGVLAHYKISGYHESEQLQNDAGDEVRVIALIDYYDIDSGSAKSVRDEQYWWYDIAEKRWYLGSPMPELGAR